MTFKGGGHEKNTKRRQIRLTTLDGVFIFGLLLVLAGLATTEKKPSFVEVMLTGSGSANRIHVADVALKRLITGCKHVFMVDIDTLNLRNLYTCPYFSYL